MIPSPEAKQFLKDEFSNKKRKLTTLVLMSIFSGVIEVIGIGLIFPFIYLLVKPEAVHQFKFLDGVMRLAHINSPGMMNVVLLIAIAFLIFFKAGYTAFFRYLQMMLLVNWKTVLSARLMRMYLYSDYELHITKGTSWIIRNIAIVGLIYDQYIMSILKIIVSATIAAGFISLLCIVLPMGALLAAVILGVLSVGIYYLSKARYKKIGKEANELYELKGQLLTKSLGAIRETKVFGKEEFFVDIFRDIERKNFTNQQVYNYLGSMPVLIVEAGIMVGILALILFYLYRNEHAQALAIMTVLLAVMFRLLPQVNNILTSMQLLNNSLDSLNVIASELANYEGKAKAEFQVTTKDKLTLQDKICFSDVSYQYANNKQGEFAIKNVNLEIRAGDFVGITGRSAAGKSTLINLLLGLLRPTKGSITVDAEDISSLVVRRKWLNNIGYVPQSIYILQDSIVSNIAYGLDSKEINIEKVYEVMRLASLDELLEKGEDYLHLPIGEDGAQLSGGQRQRIGIARALYSDPEVLILDEATANLDAGLEAEIVNRLSKMSPTKTILFISHRIHTLAMCDDILMLDNSEVIGRGEYHQLAKDCKEFGTLVEKYTAVAKSKNSPVSA